MSKYSNRRAWVGVSLAATFLLSTQALAQSAAAPSVDTATTIQDLVSALISTSTGFHDNTGVLTPQATPALSGPIFSAARPAGAPAISPALAAATGLASANISFASYATQNPLVNPNTLFTTGAANPLLPFNRGLSIFVSDVDTTAQLKFSEVFQQLSDQSHGNPDRLTLFHQLFDNENVSPGVGPAVHCDLFGTPPAADAAAFKATVKANGFPYRCPRLEGQVESVADPFTNETSTNPNAWTLIGFSNRFDLAVSPTDCGEYRLEFARNSGTTPLPDANGNLINNGADRNLMIFEARVPNPRPGAGLHGCKPILDFWAGLSNPAITTVQRGQLLHDFYLHGLPQYGVGPVVSIYNYSFGHGQIRTNQFLNTPDFQNPPTPAIPKNWTLREFKTVLFFGRLFIVPDTTKSNPGSALFAAGSTDPRVALLKQQMTSQISSMLGGGALGNINKIGFSLVAPLQNVLNTFESDESNPSQYGDLVTNFTDPDTGVVGGYLSSGGVENAALQSVLQSLLAANGATSITTLQAVERIRTQTCAGCHIYSDHNNLGAGAIWPDKTAGDANHNAMKFTQASEEITDQKTAVGDPNGKRWGISSAVECFLDNREAIMRTALNLPVPANLLTVPSANCPSN